MTHLEFSKNLYFFKNSMFKQSYRDGVDPLRSALKKESPYRKFHRIPSKSTFSYAKSISLASLLGGCFAFFVRCRAGIYPPTFFSPGPAHPIPPDEGGGGRRGNNNTIPSCRGSSAIIAPRAVRLILSGIPLSLTIGPPKGIRERGIYP